VPTPFRTQCGKGIIISVITKSPVGQATGLFLSSEKEAFLRKSASLLLTLYSLKAWITFANHVNTAFATNNPAVRVTIFGRAQ
jgi:hypothetical protein